MQKLGNKREKLGPQVARKVYSKLCTDLSTEELFTSQTVWHIGISLLPSAPSVMPIVHEPGLPPVNLSCADSRILLPQCRGIFLLTASSSLLSLTAFQTCCGPLTYTLPMVSPDLHTDMHSASLFNRKLTHCTTCLHQFIALGDGGYQHIYY